MATLLIKSEGFGERLIELKLGVNRFGRGPGNEFRIEHATVSANHCEIRVGGEGIVVRDCASTNGTFLEGRPVQEATLSSGQTLRLGAVEFLVETAEVTVAIPKFDTPRPAPPVVLRDGSMLCPRHPEARVTHQCTHCREVMCDECVHRLRRRGGKMLKLCPLCSHKCQPIAGEKPKRGFLSSLLGKTVKLPFFNSRRQTEDD
ncbi:MAG: FHA domain-containing protein [Limisphaerales bacterium]